MSLLPFLLRFSWPKWQNSQLDPFVHRPLGKKQHLLHVPSKCPVDPMDGSGRLPVRTCSSSSAGSIPAGGVLGRPFIGVAFAGVISSSEMSTLPRATPAGIVLENSPPSSDSDSSRKSKKVCFSLKPRSDFSGESPRNPNSGFLNGEYGSAFCSTRGGADGGGARGVAATTPAVPAAARRSASADKFFMACCISCFPSPTPMAVGHDKLNGSTSAKSSSLKSRNVLRTRRSSRDPRS
mmetsp:Transcript_67723/g.180312  ORF Transcript_67723/g.180312 Transcript_67723/m.180312 type:complete len:237 (-) Transcript_67723:369-1079(-)